MMCAGLMHFRASLMAMRRISWIDHRISDGVAMALFLPWSGVEFFWLRRIGVVADHRHHGEGEHGHGNVTMPAVPGSALVVPNSFLAVSKLSSIAQRWPSTATSVSMLVPAGYQVVKKTRSPSAMRRRISRPRVHKPSLALLNCPASRSASSR